MPSFTGINGEMTFNDLMGLTADGYVRDSTLDQCDGFWPRAAATGDRELRRHPVPAGGGAANPNDLWGLAQNPLPQGEGRVRGSSPYSARRREKRVSTLVTNSSSTGAPSSVTRRARRKAGPMSAGSSIRSAWPPMARAMSA